MRYYTHPGHETLDKLRRGEIVNIDGIDLIMDGDGTVLPGDLYIGARNTVRLLTCEAIDEWKGLVWPTTTDYPFNIGECVKVREAE